MNTAHFGDLRTDSFSYYFPLACRICHLQFWNLYTKQNDPLSVATVYGSASIDSKAPTSGSIRSEVFNNEEERDSWIMKTIKSKENKGYKEVDEAYTVEDAEAAKKSEG